MCDQARGRVLDIGCGADRHSLALRERGLEVTALEPSPGAAQVCRDRGVTVIGSAVEDLTVGGWDSLVLLGNNLALLGSPMTAVSTLRSLADHAAPGAVLLGLGTQPYATTDPLHLAYHERNRAAGRPGGQLRIRVRHRELATGWFNYWFMAVDEVTRAVDQTPWRLVDVTASGAAYLVHLELGR
ncbi:class I SAM-dependent methyltransferase [Parenemella sanctibonifatiensis]|uniref:class I SAM-dependent methyltransferase n=1 Tax=Parenemella sanctibonifatiensis TaxID=2016505 RepID=UPI0015C5865C|nr:methyltransferase domain-containing protein [Parenemella sanctibonifatiensis]